MRGVIAAGAALAAGLCIGAPAAVADDGFSKRTVHIPVTVGAHDDVPCEVAVDLYVPNGADAAHPAPAILMTNGFGGSKDDLASSAGGWARRGYVALAYSGLGFGGSTCKITLDDRDTDGKAGSQLVSYLARLDAVRHDGPDDPRVGMIGGSYGGQIQFAVAAVDRRVDTIVPQITWNDLSYSLTPENSSFTSGVTSATPGAGKIIWAAGFFAYGVVRGLQYAQDDPSRLLPCPNFADEVCLGLAQAGAIGGPNDTTIALLRHASVASYVHDIRIPTLLVQGQSDTLFNLQESVATYRALKAQGTPVKLVWRSAGHSGGGVSGEYDPSLRKASYEGRTYEEWMDHYLKDAPAAPSLDFTFFREWVRYDGDATPAYGRAPAYPAAGETLEQSLSSDGRLVADPATVKPGAASFATTVAGLGTSYTEISVLDPKRPPVDAPGTAAAFTSAPLDRDLDVVGVPSADLQLSAPLHEVTGQTGTVGSLVVFVRLEDVAPDGSVVLPRKLVSPVRLLRPAQAVHVELPGIVHRFAKGHRLRLVVAGGDIAYRGSNVPGPVSVVTDREHPGTLRIPVARDGADVGPVVGARVAAASAPCASRTVRLRLPRRYRAAVRTARVVVGGRTVARFGRGGTARVTVRGTRARTVRIVMRLRDGRTRVDTRRLRGCRG